MTQSRILLNMRLFNEKEIAPSIFYAQDRDGHGRLHDGKGFLGYAMPYQLPAENKFTVKIFSKQIVSPPFLKNDYPSQRAANEALIAVALKYINKK